MSYKIPDTSDEVEVVELSDEAADALADRVAERMKGATPQRSVLGDVPTKAGDAPAVFYGGHDKYSAVGATDSEVATNLYLAKVILTDPKTGKAREHDFEPAYSPRLIEVMTNAATKALGTEPDRIPESVQLSNGYIKQLDPDGFATKERAALRARAKAMVSTTAGSGDEWVPTFAASTLWSDVHLETQVSANIPRIQMPTNPFDVPTIVADVTYRLAPTENTAVSESSPTTGKATLSAKKVQAEVNFSGETTEDSILPLVPTLRRNLVRRGAQTIDDLIVHGDATTAGTGNINSDDGAPAADAFYLAFAGLRRFALITNTAQAKQYSGAYTTSLFNSQRALMGRYGARPSELLVITGNSTLTSVYDDASFLTLEKYGPAATILRGELGRIFGVPVLLSEAIPGTETDKVDDDGKYTTTSPTTNDTDGWLILVNKNGWYQGFRREFQIESDRNISTDTNTLVASFRMALIPSGISTLHTSIGYDITV